MEVTKGTIKYAGPIGSANPNGFGIAYERELIGSRCVNTYGELLSIPNALLFGSDEPTVSEIQAGAGAIWYVKDEDTHYKLTFPLGSTSITQVKWEPISGKLEVLSDFTYPD